MDQSVEYLVYSKILYPSCCLLLRRDYSFVIVLNYNEIGEIFEHFHFVIPT